MQTNPLSLGRSLLVVAMRLEKWKNVVFGKRPHRGVRSNQALNQDLSPEDAEKIADEITRETLDRMASEEEVTFTSLKEIRK